MYIPKTMVFADGENLVMRYQDMISAGRVPKKNVTHIQDVFVWHPDITKWCLLDIIRFLYYTSTSGDLNMIQEINKRIGNISYEYNYTPEKSVQEASAQIVPQLFHKPSKSKKSRHVDIQMTIDIMRSAYLQNVDLIYILSGDGDYLPLINEVMRNGKQVYVSSFSSGLNGKLPYSVDVYETLDEIFFEKPKKKTTSIALKRAATKTRRTP